MNQIDSLQHIADSLTLALSQCQEQIAQTDGSWFHSSIDMSYKIAMVIIALFNFWYVFSYNRNKSKKELLQQQNERRLSLFKTLVLDNTLSHLYVFFNELETLLVKLKSDNADRSNIESELQPIFHRVRSKFVIFVKAADPNLGESLQNQIDDLETHLVTQLEDNEINFNVKPYKQYNDKIKNKFDELKSSFIKCLYEYK